MIKTNAVSFLLPHDSSTKYPSGRKVTSAMSFAMIIEPKKVTNTSASVILRMFLKRRTMTSASHTKKRIFLNAATTASVQNRHASVLQSK